VTRGDVSSRTTTSLAGDASGKDRTQGKTGLFKAATFFAIERR